MLKLSGNGNKWCKPLPLGVELGWYFSLLVVLNMMHGAPSRPCKDITHMIRKRENEHTAALTVTRNGGGHRWWPRVARSWRHCTSRRSFLHG
jgi:hypothetical protein